MIKNNDKEKEDKKLCPYYTLIDTFKKLPDYNNTIINNDKFASITNRISCLPLSANKKDINNAAFKEVNKFDKAKKETKTENQNIINEYDENLYYYNPFPNINKPIFLIAIISFHHKKGSVVEYNYPSKEDLIKNDRDIISLLIDKKKKDLTPEKVIDDILSQLTCVCLPDGVHARNKDNQLFIIQEYKYPLYGISCYEQIKSFRDDTDENTRFSIQKSVCIISFLPFYSTLFSKLSMTVDAFFNQETLKDKKIIHELYDNYKIDKNLNYNIQEMNYLFSTRKLLCFTKEKIFVILKMILLEKKILIFSSVGGNVCSFIYTLISLIPGQILFNFRGGEPINNYIRYLETFGFPLKIFNERYKLFPLVTLFDIDKIESLNKKMLIGTTNQIILDEAINKKKYDLIINIDTEKVIHIFNKNNKEKKEVKEIRENKETYEENKTEKNTYNIIHNKLKELNIKYSNTKWLNTFDEQNSSNINDDAYDCNEMVDNFIRNEFQNYFKEMFIKLSLYINIVKNNSVVRLLEIPKESIFFQYIQDDKTIKKLFKILIPNSGYAEFLYLYTKTKSFEYWLKEHDSTLYYLSDIIASDKNLTLFLEDGSTYVGQYKNGQPNGFGSLTSYDNTVLYDGEFKNGLKHGIGKLVVTDKYNYSGPFENDVICGSNGILCDNAGNIYEGDFDNGKFNGFGKYKMSNGDSYLGEFKGGLFHGKGLYQDKNGNIFDGQYLNGKKEGKGIIIKNTGEKIEGEFANDKLVNS